MPDVTLQVAVIIPEHTQLQDLLTSFDSDPGKTEKLSIFKFSNKIIRTIFNTNNLFWKFFTNS